MRKVYFHIFFIAVAGLIAYSNTFNVPFQFDDRFNISENPVVQRLDNFISKKDGYEYNPRRYVGYLTFALNYRLGGIQVAGYHAANLFIHISAALALYLLILLTFRTPYFRSPGSGNGGGEAQNGSSFSRGSPELIALFSALFFVSHPVQTQAVTYIVQRFTSLTALFYLLSVGMYIKARIHIEPMGTGERARGDSKNRGRLASVPFFVLSLTFAVLAMRTKEIAFTLPVVIILYEFIFFSSSFKKKLLFLLPVFLTIVIIPAGLIGLNRPLGDIISDLSERTRVQTNIPRWDYLITQIRVVTTYVRLLFLPVGQNLDYDYPVRHTILAPSVLISLLFLGSLVAAAVYLLHKAHLDRKQQGGNGPFYRLIGFGILWFFVTLSVESSFIPIVDVIFEHRVYLPSAGAFLAITGAFFILCEKLGDRLKARVPAVSILAFAVLAFTSASFARNMVWQDEEVLWRDVIQKSPGNARAYNNLGYVIFEKGRVDEAAPYFLRAVKLNRTYADAHTNLGAAYFSKGSTYQAIEQFQSALVFARSIPERASSHHDLGLAYAKAGMLPEAIAEFEASLKGDPANPEVYSDMGVIYKQRNLPDKAIESYLAALRLKPDYAPAYYNLAVVYKEQRFMERAEEYFRKAHDLDPTRF